MPRPAEPGKRLNNIRDATRGTAPKGLPMAKHICPTLISFEVPICTATSGTSRGFMVTNSVLEPARRDGSEEKDTRR